LKGVSNIQFEVVIAGSVYSSYKFRFTIKRELEYEKLVAEPE